MDRDLNSNQLNGTIPFTLGNLSSLTKLYVSSRNTCRIFFIISYLFLYFSLTPVIQCLVLLLDVTGLWVAIS